MAIQEAELGPPYADDLARRAVDDQRPADGRGIAAEAAQPEAVAEEHGLRSARRVVRAAEQAPDQRPRPQERQDAVGDLDHLHLLRLRQPGHRRLVVVPHAAVGEGLALLAVGEVERWPLVDPVPAETRRGVPDPDQAVRLRVRQRLQEHAADDAEDGGVGADPDRQGDDGDGGEQRCASEAADGVAELAGDRAHGTPSFRSAGGWSRTGGGRCSAGTTDPGRRGFRAAGECGVGSQRRGVGGRLTCERRCRTAPAPT